MVEIREILVVTGIAVFVIAVIALYMYVLFKYDIALGARPGTPGSGIWDPFR